MITMRDVRELKEAELQAKGSPTIISLCSIIERQQEALKDIAEYEPHLVDIEDLQYIARKALLPEE